MILRHFSHAYCNFIMLCTVPDVLHVLEYVHTHARKDNHIWALYYICKYAIPATSRYCTCVEFMTSLLRHVWNRFCCTNMTFLHWQHAIACPFFECSADLFSKWNMKNWACRGWLGCFYVWDFPHIFSGNPCRFADVRDWEVVGICWVGDGLETPPRHASRPASAEERDDKLM